MLLEFFIFYFRSRTFIVINIHFWKAEIISEPMFDVLINVMHVNLGKNIFKCPNNKMGSTLFYSPVTHVHTIVITITS